MEFKKVGIVSLGCPKNLVDSEVMLGLLKEGNFIITNDEKEADIIIINTCGFIESAKQESINTILEMQEYKNDKCKCLIVTGCMAERYREEIIKEIPQVDAVIGTGNYKDIVQAISSVYNGDKIVLYGKLDEVDYLNSERMLTSKNGYSYLKIAEGCDNCCTYCIIPSLRGRYRSRKIEDIVLEANRLVSQGTKEIVLVAQDVTRYGIDIYKEKKLVDLIKELSKIREIEWIRLLYCYPEEIDDRLISEISENKKVCKYLDIPIQHISDRILKTMGRRGKKGDIKGLLDKLQERVPGIFIRTTFIVGFPGETEQDFNELKEFVQQYEFDNLGVFMYSREEGTPAGKIKPQINMKTKNSRYNEVMNLQRLIIQNKNERRQGNIYKTIVDGISDDGIFYYGRTHGESPDIDGLVYFTSEEELKVGDFVNVKILNVDEYDLIGAVYYESSK